MPQSTAAASPHCQLQEPQAPGKLMTFEFVAICAISILAFCNIAIFYGFYSYLTEIGIPAGWRGPLLSLEPLTALVARPFLGRYLTLNNGVRFMRVGMALAPARCSAIPSRTPWRCWPWCAWSTAWGSSWW